MHFTYQVITQKKDTKKMKENKTLKRIIIVVLLLTGISAFPIFESYFTVSIFNDTSETKSIRITLKQKTYNDDGTPPNPHPHYIIYQVKNKNTGQTLVVMTEENSPKTGDTQESAWFDIQSGETITMILRYNRNRVIIRKTHSETFRISTSGVNGYIASFEQQARPWGTDRLTLESYNPQYMYKSNGFKDDYIYREDNIFPLIFGNQMDEIQSFWL